MNLFKQKIFFLCLSVCAVVTQSSIAYGAEEGRSAVKLDAGQVAKAKMLATRYACLSCHAVERKLVGPSYRDIAMRYSHTPKAVDVLAAKIKSGSVGQWGQIPMPAHPKISDADLKILAMWVLSNTATPAK